MPKVDVLDMNGKKVGEFDLAAEIFDIPVNEYIVTDCIIAELANRRQGTHSTMNRSRIRGGGRKPFRQKGTGRARAGSTRSPIWRHGAVAHGPQPRDYSKKVPRRIKRLAYKCVLTDKVREGRLVVIDDMNLDAIKTRSMVDFIANVAQQVPEDRKRLLVTRESNHNVYYSARNIPEVNVIPSNNLSIYELVKADRVVFSKDALEKVVEVLSK